MSTVRCTSLLLNTLMTGLLWLVGSVALASGLQVAPMSLTIQPPEMGQALWLNNTGKNHLHAQVRAYRWQQSQAEDTQLKQTRDLVVSPPIVDIEPGEKQLVRVIFSGQPATGPNPSEKTYRLVVNELPPSREKRHQGVQFILRYSLPVFVRPVDADAPLSPDLKLSFRSKGEQTLLVAHNEGNQHARLTQAKFVGTDGQKTALKNGLFGYVLPRSGRQWQLPDSVSTFTEGGELRAKVNGESKTIPVEPIR